MQTVHIAGMLLAVSDGILKSERPQDIFSTAMDYKVELSMNHPEVILVLGRYMDKLSTDDKTFFEKHSGIYSGEPSYDGNIAGIMESLSEIEKQEGLLRKLVNNIK